MSYDPSDPDWPDRDRFVLSCGHACILLYSMLYLTGYGVELEDLRQFRQLHSRTPGHPEVHDLPGIEVTTGPLGQGFANGVGLGHGRADAAGPVRPRRRRPSHLRDLQRRRPHGGHQPRGGLAGRPPRAWAGSSTSTTTTTSPSTARPSSPSTTTPATRFEAYGWHVDRLGEVANDTDALEAALRRAMAVEDRPSLLILRSHIGWPAPHLTDSPKAHGSPLGEDEVRATKEILGLPPDETFWVPDEVLDYLPAGDPPGPGGRGARGRSGWPPGRAIGTSGTPSGRAGAVPAGRRSSRRGARRASRSPPASPSTPPSTPSRTEVPGLVAGGADLTGNTGTKLDDDRAAEPRAPGGPGHRLRRPRARHGRRHSTAWPPRRRHPDRRHLLRLQRLHARVGPPGRPVARPRSSTSGATTRSGSARTARPTSRSSSWPPCGPCPASG